MSAIQQHGIQSFELVVVNLYPFAATVARQGVTIEEAIEQIDIGGPSLVRAAAKNHRYVTIATSAAQYAAIVKDIQQHGATTAALRRRLAMEAFQHTAVYDRVIADYFARQLVEGPFEPQLNLSYEQVSELRYGENPHQRAAVYRPASGSGPSVVSARQLNGKELSYNNLLDLDSALGIVRCFEQPAAVVIKHNNTCGLAVDQQLAVATQKALDGDPVSAFGSVLGFNRPLDLASADVLCQPGLFVEAIVAPQFDPEAVERLTTIPKWKSNVRLLQVGSLDELPQLRQLRFLEGGLLVQDADVLPDEESAWRVVTDKWPWEQPSGPGPFERDRLWNLMNQLTPDEPLLHDLRFAWRAVRHVKSNAIAVCSNRMLCGAGAGQMSRVDSVEIALTKAGTRAAGAVLASDAFFPFPDSIDRAAAAGIAAIIQPGGSRNDDEVIARCNQHQLPMVFTGRRHFKH
jgi:phosphoribosylaminoimidazolecarboxamide formyltransferase/IMP cyclohydrolase